MQYTDSEQLKIPKLTIIMKAKSLSAWIPGLSTSKNTSLSTT